MNVSPLINSLILLTCPSNICKFVPYDNGSPAKKDLHIKSIRFPTSPGVPIPLLTNS
nr:MAG TPA: hypothetical protein [Bacteriophage sp.]